MNDTTVLIDQNLGLLDSYEPDSLFLGQTQIKFGGADKKSINVKTLSNHENNIYNIQFDPEFDQRIMIQTFGKQPWYMKDSETNKNNKSRKKKGLIQRKHKRKITKTSKRKH